MFKVYVCVCVFMLHTCVCVRCVSVSMRYGPNLTCYHFLNDLCFHCVMDYIPHIDINFPEQEGKLKKRSPPVEYIGTRVIL